MQERVRVLADLPAQTSYFFNDNYEYDEKAVDKRLAKSGVSDTLVLWSMKLQNYLLYKRDCGTSCT
ncbi:MAG: hypothetical protein H7A34_04220 [bacterium]|nr:hypothetical protein [bacterium]